MENLLNNNITLVGEISTNIAVSHEVYGEVFYNFTLTVPRLSESADNISITVSERLTNIENLQIGVKLKISGQFRSYNNYSGVGNKLLLTVFAKEVNVINDISNCTNIANLTGFICKEPIYRTTPFGREIADLLVAVNRSYGKSDYIPCIAWGRDARFVQNLSIGDKIELTGRIQSREYQKKIGEETTVVKTAYEISVSKIQIAQN